jgi:hypothetical protein
MPYALIRSLGCQGPLRWDWLLATIALDSNFLSDARACLIQGLRLKKDSSSETHAVQIKVREPIKRRVESRHEYIYVCAHVL